MIAESTRARYASDPAQSRGRIHPETPSRTRSEFQRDRDRVIHCAAFRRLAHKTQVFLPDGGDHFRTRLTHSVEVAQIARAIARSLRLDEDLTEALALAHDLGHACFGHAGEDALQACMSGAGGFDHNAQTLRIVTRLERRYARYDGLNLCWETVEGLVKHNGPLLTPVGLPTPKYAGGLPQPIIDLDSEWNLDLKRFSSAEAQVAALADDIAYDAHDIDDGLRSGLLRYEDLAQAEFLATQMEDIERRHPRLDPHRRAYELMRRVITALVEDATFESLRRLAALDPRGPEDIRAAHAPVVSFSSPIREADSQIKAFLTANLYRLPTMLKMRDEAATVVGNLFERLLRRPEDLPAEWAHEVSLAPSAEAKRARIVCDYIAGMTDRFALREHARLFGWAPDLR